MADISDPAEARLISLDRAIQLAATGRIEPDDITEYAETFHDYLLDLDLAPTTRISEMLVEMHSDETRVVVDVLDAMVSTLRAHPGFACEDDRVFVTHWLDACTSHVRYRKP